VVPVGDNYFAALNSAVFSDGSFVFIPQGRALPDGAVDLLPDQRRDTGQFERTLIIAEEGSHVSYLEGCTAPMRDENQLHAAVVELVALDDAQIKYSTVQNWYPGRRERRRRHLQLRHQARPNAAAHAARSPGPRSKPVRPSPGSTRAACCGRRLGGRVLFGGAHQQHRQQADTGTKMIHLGRNTKSKIVSKGISAGRGQNTYRGLVKVEKSAAGARNHTQCDSLLIGKQCGAHTFPYIEVKRPDATVEHEATTSKIGDDQLFYCRARGQEDAVSMIEVSARGVPRAADGVRGG
jgi:Fe-S cluster assembly protein SufB